MTDYPNPDPEVDGWANQPLPMEAPTGGGWVLTDPATGEVLTPPDVVEGELVPDDGDRAALPARIAAQGLAAVEWYRTPDDVRRLAVDAKAALLAGIEQMAADAKVRRPDGRVTPAVVADELRLLTDAAESLAAVVGVFTAAERLTKRLAGEVAHETQADPTRGSTTVKVSGPGGVTKVTRTQPTETAADPGKVVDALVPFLLLDMKPGTPAKYAAARAQGIRDGIERYRSLVESHKFKSTALDALGQAMQAAGEDQLAQRLGAAYGRVPKGNPSVKMTRESGEGA